jgi:tetratricopeptide (TPR) repeat protein
MMRFTVISFSIFFQIIGLNVIAQNNKLDSLRNELKIAKHDTLICHIYREIGYAFEQKQPDSALYYYNISLNLAKEKNLLAQQSASIRYIGIVHRNKGDYDKALELFFESLKLAEQINDNTRIAAANSSIGLVYYNRGSFDEAIEFQLKAASIEELLENKQGLTAIYNNIGIIYDNLGLYDKAIDYHHKSLNLKDEIDDKAGVAASYTNIGSIHYNQGEKEKSLEYYLKALEIYEKTDNARGLAASYNNIGLIYRSDEDYEKAIEYYLKSLEIREKLGEKRGLFINYNNLGIVHRHIGDYATALDYYQKAVKISEEIKDKHGQSVVFNSIANLYLTLADSSDISARNSYLKTAKQYSHKAYDLAVETGSLVRQSFAANILRIIYTRMGICSEALKYAEIFIAANDSVFNQEKSKAIAEAEKKFQAEKKQLQIEKLEQEKVLQQTEISRQQEVGKMQIVLIVIIVFGLVIISVFLAIVINRLKTTRKQKHIIEDQKIIVEEKNIMLNEQNEEIRAQHDEIEHQRDEIAAQRDMVVRQKEHIEFQKNQITDSISYAKLIQTAVLPTNDYANNLLGEHFILFKPKDIVSGDFYWITKVKNKKVVAVADCTGHGVAGAFMSMLGLSFLKEIVGKKGITDPAEILGHLRDDIIEALQQKGKMTDQKDGMDMALCVFDETNLKLSYAGANIPLVIISKQNELNVILPDKQPIAFHRKMKLFANNEIQLSKGDSIYLASDGYQNQLGGEFYKMFMSKNYHKLLTEISDNPMSQQKNILIETYELWKGEHEQVDDVTVIGIRV